MTSEIAVMNQRAVALAADSAVTIGRGSKTVVRNERRKLFQVADLPVGVMVFGVADLMGHPWEVLLEHFQKQTKLRPMPHVRDYPAKFMAALDGLESFFPRARLEDEYKRLLASVFRFIANLARWLHQEDTSGSHAEALKQAIAAAWQRYQTREDGSPRPDLPCFPAGFADTVRRDHAGSIEEMIAYGFPGLPLDETMRRQLRDIAVFCVVKDLFLEDVTGLVTAGYGAEENYPVVVVHNVSGVVGGFVKRAEVDVTAIGTEMRSGISLFADCEASYAFLRGMELDLEVRIYAALQGIGASLVEQAVASFPGVEAAERDSVRRKLLTQLLPDHIRRFHGVIAGYQQQAYVDPILRALEIATKPDLAEMARELVALNIFKKKIRAGAQTVGGAVDVALISRDGGFSWVQRQKG